MHANAGAKKQRNTINQYFPARPDMRAAVAMADAACQAGPSSLQEASEAPAVSFSQQEQQMEVLQQQLEVHRCAGHASLSCRHSSACVMLAYATTRQSGPKWPLPMLTKAYKVPNIVAHMCPLPRKYV